MNKIVHISAEIIDASALHKITKKNSVCVTRIHNAYATRHYQCTLHIFISCSPIGWSPEGVYEYLLIHI